MPLFDCKCERCQTVWEEIKEYKAPAPDCPSCGSSFTHTILTGPKVLQKAKDPYDYLNGRIPSKPIKSFARDRRRGGKDTT